MIFKQETLQSLFTGVSSSVNSQIIKPFANAEQVIWKYNQAIQHNSLTQKGWERLLAQSDDSMRAYLTSIKGSTASMTGYTTSLQGNITGFKKVSSAISQYNTLSAQGVAEQKTFATAVSTTNGKLGTYLSGLNGAKASMGGYIKSLITAKAASIGLKVATVALNASFSMGISLLVSKLISSITEYSERISTAAEKAGEALDTAKSNVKELNSLIKEYNDLQISGEWDNTSIETKKQLQKDINALLDDEADKLDIINGKYEETTAELYKQKLAKLSEQEKSAYDALEAEKDALWDENKYTNLSFKYGYSNKDGVEYYDDLDVIEKYVKEYDDVLQAWKKTSLSASSSTSAFVGTDDPKNVEELITQYDRLKQLSQEMYDNGDTGAFYDSINSYLDELEERVKKIHGYETDFDDAQSANNLGKILTDPSNGFGGYIETLEEYQKVVDFINNSDYENKEGILEVLASDFYEFATQVENAGNTVDDFGNRITVFKSFDGSIIGERLQHITEEFENGSLSHKEYFDALQSEIDNVDFSNYTNSIEDANEASQQFFTDSIQQVASGLSGLINDFDSGNMSISEYLEGYLSIGNTLSTLTDNLQENSSAWNENGEAISDSMSSALDNTQSQLQTAMTTIESYQDSIYSLEQILTNSVKEGTDEFTAHTNVIAQDLYNIVQTGGIMADEIKNTLGTTTAEIAKSLTENVSNQELACQAIMGNTNTAIQNMATAIGELFDTLGKQISNFKVDLNFGIKSIDWKKVDIFGKEFSLPEIKFELGASGESLQSIGDAVSSFGKTVASNFTPQTIELEDFHFSTTENGKNDDYSPSSGVLKNYEDALDKVKDGSKSAKNQFEETVDFFEERIEELNNALDLLKANLENVVGSFAKNKLIDAEIGISKESFRNYSDALDMYTAKANEALSKLPSDIAEKVKNGAIDLTTFIGDGNKEIVDAIKEYDEWADKVADCKQQLAELKEVIRDLELEKFQNIAQDFEDQFNLRDSSIDLIDKQIALFEEAGELIGESFFVAQKDQATKQLGLLTKQKEELSKQLSSALSSGNVEVGTDEWLEMVEILGDVEGQILDCKKSIEEFDNAILDLNWQVFERIQDTLGNFDSELGNLVGLLDDIDVFKDGSWTTDAITKLGLLSQQYELAQHQVGQYNDAIDELQKQYMNGSYSATEYVDKLAELSDQQWQSVESAESAKDAIIELNKARIDEEIEGIEKTVSEYEKLIQAQIDALDAEKD